MEGSKVVQSLHSGFTEAVLTDYDASHTVTKRLELPKHNHKTLITL